MRSHADEEIGPFHRACLAAALAVGLARVDDLDDLDGDVGFGVQPVNVQGGLRINAAFAYLDPVCDRRNLRVIVA